jgi:predicted DNA-binding WGR domain protein
MQRFELSEGTHNKFWEVAREGSSVTVRFGRIGSDGQTQTKAFDSDEKAEAELAKLVKEKTKKGYAEVGAPVAAASPKMDDEPKGKAKAPPKAAVEPSAPLAQEADGFLDAGKGYALGIRDGKLCARNPKGQILSSIPKDLKEGELAEQLAALVEWLDAHARDALTWIDTFMLRSLPLPASVITNAWADEAYRRGLENLVVFAATKEGTLDPSRGGMLKGTDAKRGIGVIDRDGETAWLSSKEILVPHPIAIEALDDWRALATELGATQGAQQLFREVFARPADLAKGATAIDRFAGGSFKQLNHAIGTAKSAGYRVSGGSATLRILEAGRTMEARFWIGEGDPESETETGSLVWVDDKQMQLSLDEVTPLAFSEGMRMASLIHKKRVIEERQEAA